MPRGHEHISFVFYERFSGHFFSKFCQNKIVMGKKDRCAVFGCNHDRLFPEKCTVKDHISNTKLEKGDDYYIQTRHNYLFSHQNLILRKFKKKCPERRSYKQTKCAHAPWASYNTPSIKLIPYGRRIGKEVY